MNPLLIIDPGHGGIDPGGGSNQLFLEKDKVLDISLYQYHRFQQLGISVTLTRSADVTLESDQRAEIVRNSGARYCISNHINAGGGRGSEAIYSIYGTAVFPKALVEELETAGMPNRRVFTRTYPGNPKLDYYFMHRETGKVETVILEYGFADNPADAQLLHQRWRELAEAIVRGFCEFVQRPYFPPSGTTDPPPVEPPENPPVQPGAAPVPANWHSLPEWKREGVDWLYEQGLLTSGEWRERIDQPLPLWAESILLRRLAEKLRGG